MNKYRIYPSKKQQAILNKHIQICRLLYNQQVENKIIWYQDKGMNLSYQNLNSMLLDLRVIYPELKQPHSQVIQDVNNRIIKAFDKFFTEPEVGYPRFKGKYRYNSITYPQSGYKFISQKHLKVSKIGNLAIRLHRIPKGKVKTMTIKRTPTNKWFVCFSCEVDIPTVVHPSKVKVGIDVGLEHFATLSNGEVIDNPRFLVENEQRLKFFQRKLSKRRKGSVKRNKMRVKVARLHEKIANQRSDFHHKISRFIANNYGYVAVEDLNIKSMLSNHYLAKSICDVSWDSFVSKLGYKGEETGCQVVGVNPRMTSKRCSRCGVIIDMPLSTRKFKCPKCDFVCHRDINASHNILFDSFTAGTAESNAFGVVPLGTAMNKEASSKA